jgi:FdhE protein
MSVAGAVETGVRRLEELASSDPTLAVLARLQAVALRATSEAGWLVQIELAAPDARAAEAPLLHQATLTVDPTRLRGLLDDLSATLAPPRLKLGRAARGLGSALDEVLALVEASIVQDDARLAHAAESLGADRGVVALLPQLAALPLLHASAQQDAAALPRTWTLGPCPVCGGWAGLCEMRGVDRERWLRCTRCTAEWRFPHGQCPFCGDTDHRNRGYLATQKERESRRADVCNACKAYVKQLTTFGALAPYELLLRDLTSLELDLAALQAGYTRPAGLGFPLVLHLRATDSPRQGR